MTIPQFVHLRLHSEYSITDSLIRINSVVNAAAQDHQAALAITDLSNMFGVIKFYQAACHKGIKPIIGCDVWITNKINRNQPSRLLLLVKNYNGYLQLCNLLSRASLSNSYQNRAEIHLEWFRDILNEGCENGLIALSGAHCGAINIAINNGDLQIAENCAKCLKEIFPNAFYIEIQRTGQLNAEIQVQQSVALATKLKLPVVATHPIQFLKSSEFIAHEVRTCIAEGNTLSNVNRTKRFKEQQYFKTQKEMTALFSDIPGAILNTIEITKRCNFILKFGNLRLPNFPTPKNIDINNYLILQATEGLKKRLYHLYLHDMQYTKQISRYEQRLKFETNIIIKMGFSSYFLIVADFIQWAKKNCIPVGPGRGSGASSLVAYSLLITDVDPLKYNLLFERFLNPERVSMPDFDIDFCQEGRDQVIQYVKQRYGKDAVSQIATFGTMAAKGAIRDVGRVLNFSYSFCNRISKLIPFKPGKLITIADAIKDEPLLKERQDNEEDVKKLLNLAQQVEGLTRNIGMHAGGVLIVPGKLTDFCPLYTQSDESSVISQYDKDDIELIGLVKFDFLGLTTLTILDRTVRYIKQLDASMKNFNLSKIALNDQNTYNLLKLAQTVAVFQLESRGMRNMLIEAKPDRFEDIIALVALYRPGPIDLISEFCKRKHGQKFTYLDPRMKEILSETYGIMVYQEQVMQIAQIIGGYSLGNADLLRRAMSKKKVEDMATHRVIFRQGAAQNGLTQNKADEIFDLMEKFAGYGFNKSHATAYALLSYYTAYLKTHHPAAFMAANLSLAMEDTNKIKTLLEDVTKICGLSLLKPDINFSNYYFTPVGQHGKPVLQIRYGLGAIKGLGKTTIETIIVARKNKPFKDLFDFFQRIDKRCISRRTTDSLIQSGAFDCFGEDRAVLQASVSVALEHAEQIAASINQINLFNHDKNHYEQFLQYTNIDSWTDKQRLTYEKNVLGFYLSGHLFNTYQDELRRFIKTNISDIRCSNESRWFAGIITTMRTQITYRGKILIITLDDGSGVINAIISNDLFELNKSYFQEDELLILYGKVVEDRFSGTLRIIVTQVIDICAFRIKHAKCIAISIFKEIAIHDLKNILLSYQKTHGLPCMIKYTNGNITCEIMFGHAWRILPSDNLKTLLEKSFGNDIIKIEY